MTLLSKTAKVRWNPRNKKRFEEFGYVYTKMGDEFNVLIEHLSEGSCAIVKLQCDYCGEIIERKYEVYNKLRKRDVENGINKDCCSKLECINEKIKEINNIKYGTDYPMQNKEFYNNVYVESLKKNYGVINNFQRKEVKEKIKEYWEENPDRLAKVKLKQKETSLKRYGVDNPSKHPDIIQKIKQTHLEKYGVENIMQIPEIKEQSLRKRAITVYLEGSKVSTQQIYINKLLNWELNYPVDKLNLDIANPKENIYIEYHGSGHWLSVEMGDISEKEFNEKERKRQYFLKNRGWKLIRIISKKDYLPSDDELLEIINKCINYLKSKNKSWIEINMDKMKLIGSDIEEDLYFKEVKRAYKEYLEKKMSC